MFVETGQLCQNDVARGFVGHQRLDRRIDGELRGVLFGRGVVLRDRRNGGGEQQRQGKQYGLHETFSRRLAQPPLRRLALVARPAREASAD